MKKVTLDLDKCVACGMCVKVCPDVFEVDKETLKVVLKGGLRKEKIWVLETEDSSDCASKASDACMMNAIFIEE
jgi:ferredoxin